MIGILACTPEPGGRWAVVFPPWYGAGDVLQAVVAADGRLVRFGSAPWIAVIAPTGHLVTLQQRLSASGALAFINPQIVGGCDTASTKPSSAR